ncbi:MAG TPA: HEAT repeat domain-containing protein [Gaiellaceae bacterium]|nr:HEAT repeat domain-containing protein [Gaiellaceae bacterium]
MEEYDSLVEQLALKDHAQAALQALMYAGAAATAAVRRGLRHDEPIVRVRCCMVLDHHLDEAAIPELIANLDHREGRVRAWALHALSCDQCKEGECHPAEEVVVPIALEMLSNDRSRKVRTMAASMLGLTAHRREDAARALEAARDGDPHPVVRQVAGWYAPGGQVYRRLA